MPPDTSKMKIPKGLKDQPMYRWSGNGMASRDRNVILKKEVDFLPSLDQAAYYEKPNIYDSDADSDTSLPPGCSSSNSGNKIGSRAQFNRHGKLSAWTPFFEDVQTDLHCRKRFAACLEQLMPAAAADVNMEVPENITWQIQHRKRRKAIKEQRAKYILPHLASPSPPLKSEQLAPMLAIPESYVDVMMSPSMKHTLGDDTVEQGLQRTAAELLDGEKPLLQALGRLRDILRLRQRDVPIETKSSSSAEDLPPRQAPLLDDLPREHENDNLWHFTQGILKGPNPPVISYRASALEHLRPESLPAPAPASATASSTALTEPVITPTQALFVVPTGITLWPHDNTVTDINSIPWTDAGLGQKKWNIRLPDQIDAVDESLERLSELLSDCVEYKTRLEEARDRVADVARARKKVWSVIRRRAGEELDRLEEREARGEVTDGAGVGSKRL